LNSGWDIKNGTIKLSNVLNLRYNENRVKFNISTLPFVEKTDFLIEIRFQGIADCFFFVKSISISISDYWDQEISKDEKNKEKVEEPNEPTHIDHEHGIPSKTVFLFLFQISTPFRIIRRWNIIKGISPCRNHNTNEFVKIWIVVLRIACSNWV